MVQHQQVLLARRQEKRAGWQYLKARSRPGLVSEPKPDLVHIGLLCSTVAKHLLPTVSSMYAVFVLFVQSCLKTMIRCL